MSVFLEIIIMLLILGVLVSIHEAGHLGVAKLFNVYCFEYSIGMGPAIIHKKKKGGETYFSVRCIPFGGYVSMYGEAENVVLEKGQKLPSIERSLEFIAKWKKILVLFAGVFLNFLLGILLIFVSISCFEQYYSCYLHPQDGQNYLFTSQVLDETSKNQIELSNGNSYSLDSYKLFLGLETYELNDGSMIETYIVSSNVVITDPDGNSNGYVALYSPTTLLKERLLVNDLVFYKPLNDNSYEKYAGFAGTFALPNLKTEPFTFSKNGTYMFDFSIYFCPIQEGETENRLLVDSKVKVDYSNVTYDGKNWSGCDLKLKVISNSYSFKESCEVWAEQTPSYCLSIVKGLGSLFTKDGINEVSGIVGMTQMVGVVTQLGGASKLILLAGILSVNLAIFNLIPFPGLDGYQILVTALEGITKKKVPSKFKAIVSFVGIVLLFGLMILITIKDIAAL